MYSDTLCNCYTQWQLVQRSPFGLYRGRHRCDNIWHQKALPSCATWILWWLHACPIETRLAMPSLTCLMEALLWHCWNWTSHSTKNWCPWLLGRRRGDCPHCRMSWGEKPLLSYFQSYKIKGWLSSLGQRKGFSSLHHQDPKLIWRCSLLGPLHKWFEGGSWWAIETRTRRWH